MVTKEHESKKYCCFYVSEYHLEMILLPYIKNNLINKNKILIYTEENLLESIKLVLDRTNLNDKEKEEVLKLNWEGKAIKDNIDDNDKKIVIINGNEDYIKKINKEIERMKNINIVDCYKINDVSTEITELKDNYDEILNTKKM